MNKSWSHFYAGTIDIEFLIKNTAVHLEMFKHIYGLKPKRILEVGSGTGSMAVFTSYLGYDVISLDNDQKVLDKAKEVAHEFNGRVSFIKADAFKLPFKNKELDLIFHQGLLEHFDDKEILKLLDEQLRVAKYVILSVPNNHYPRKDFGNERLLTKDYWDKLLSTNYKLLESQNYNAPRKGITREGGVVIRPKGVFYLAKITKNK